MRILALLIISLTLFSCKPIGGINDLSSDDSSPEVDLGVKSMEEIMEAEDITRLLDFPTILKKELIQIEGDSLHLGKVYATHSGPATFLVEIETASRQYAIRNVARINMRSAVSPEEENKWVYFPIMTSRQWNETAEDLTRRSLNDESPAIYTRDFYVPGDTLEVSIRKIYSSTRVGVRTKHYYLNDKIVIRKVILADGRELKIEAEDVNGEMNVTLQFPSKEQKTVDVQASLQENRLIFKEQ